MQLIIYEDKVKVHIYYLNENSLLNVQVRYARVGSLLSHIVTS